MRLYLTTSLPCLKGLLNLAMSCRVTISELMSREPLKVQKKAKRDAKRKKKSKKLKKEKKKKRKKSP